MDLFYFQLLNLKMKLRTQHLDVHGVEVSEQRRIFGHIHPDFQPQCVVPRLGVMIADNRLGPLDHLSASQMKRCVRDK